MAEEIFPLNACRRLSINNSAAELVEFAVRRNEGRLAASGAFVVETGQHTGRSVEDKFIVRDDDTNPAIWWDNNKAMTEEQFDRLLQDFREFAKFKELFVQDLHAGADPAHQLPTRVFCEYAWHGLFIRNLLRRPAVADLLNFKPGLTIVALPSFRAAPSRGSVAADRPNSA